MGEAKRSGACAGSLTPYLTRHILAQLMDRLAITSECQHARKRRSDERVQALLVSMALIWAKLAGGAEQIERTRLGATDDDTALH